MIDEQKLLALLDRYLADHAGKMETSPSNDSDWARWNRGAWFALTKIKVDIIEHHHDLEAEL